MQTDQIFTITFTKQNGESTTRKAKWTDKCQEFVAQAGHNCLTFLDLEATEKRTFNYLSSKMDRECFKSNERN